MSETLRVAIIGCGWVAGSQMERGFSQLGDQFSVTVCCDRTLDKARAFAEQNGIAVALEDYDAVLAREDVDVVSICTPPSAHHAMVLAALAAGKHVICEKPFTSSLALMDEVIAAEGRSGKRVMPIFQYRFAPGIERVQALLRSDLPGRAYVSSVETAWLRRPEYYSVPWRGKFATELGGVLLTQAIHIHDLFMWLMGPVEAVKAFKTTRVNPIEVEDCAVASLTMRDGSLASLTATLGAQRPVTRIRLCFEHLTIERQSFDDQAPRPGYEPWTVHARNREVETETQALMETVTPGPSDFAGQFADFHDALARERPFTVTLEDARRSLELVSALFHAAETDETVRLPIADTHPRYMGWGPRND